MVFDHAQLYNIAKDKIILAGSCPYPDYYFRRLYEALALVAYNRIPGKVYIKMMNTDSPYPPFNPADYTATNGTVSLSDEAMTEDDSRLFIMSGSGNFPADYKELLDVEQYLSGAVQVYQNAAKHITVVVKKENKSLSSNHFVSTITRLFPWLFKTHPVTSDEYSYLGKLAAGDLDARDYALKFYQQQGFEEKAIDVAVESMISGSLDDRKRKLESDIKYLLQSIAGWRNEIKNKLREIESKNEQLAGLSGKDEASAAAEIKDYLHNQKGITVTATTDNDLSLKIITTLSNFDPDAVDSYVLNHPDWFLGYNNISDIKLLFRAIFAGRTYKVKIGAVYELDSCCHVTPKDNAMDVNKDNCIPNPHINKHSCLGNYEPMLDDAEDHRDYISAIAICQQSASSMNLLELISTKYFFTDFKIAYNTDLPIIINPQGEEITPKQAIAELKGANK